MNISKILIIIAVLLMIFLVACEPDTGPPVEVVEATEENRTKYIKNKKYPPAK